MNIIQYLKGKGFKDPDTFLTSVRSWGTAHECKILDKQQDKINMLAARLTAHSLEFLAEKRKNLLHMDIVALPGFRYTPQEILQHPDIKIATRFMVTRNKYPKLDTTPDIQKWVYADDQLVDTYFDEAACTEFFGNYTGSARSATQKYVGGAYIVRHSYRMDRGKSVNAKFPDILRILQLDKYGPSSDRFGSSYISNVSCYAYKLSFFQCKNGKLMCYMHTNYRAPDTTVPDGTEKDSLQNCSRNISNIYTAADAAGLYKKLHALQAHMNMAKSGEHYMLSAELDQVAYRTESKALETIQIHYMDELDHEAMTQLYTQELTKRLEDDQGKHPNASYTYYHSSNISRIVPDLQLLKLYDTGAYEYTPVS